MKTSKATTCPNHLIYLLMVKQKPRLILQLEQIETEVTKSVDGVKGLETQLKCRDVLKQLEFEVKKLIQPN